MTVEKFKHTFQEMGAHNVEIIESLYGDKVIFLDPFHKVVGIDALKEYFERLYKNVNQISFEFGEHIQEGNNISIQWIMHLEHPKLNGGEPVRVVGVSLLKVNPIGEVIFHRDYFDGGSMLYEQVPVIGFLVKWLKKRL